MIVHIMTVHIMTVHIMTVHIRTVHIMTVHIMILHIMIFRYYDCKQDDWEVFIVYKMTINKMTLYEIYLMQWAFNVSSLVASVID